MLQFSKNKKIELIVHTSCFLLVVLWALIQLWGKRFFEHYNDGVSYLDMASYYMQGNWLDGFNSFWNPLYPAFIAFVFNLLHPNIFHEFIALKLVNLLIFLCLLGSFEYFFRTFTTFYNVQIKNGNEFCHPSKRTWLIVGYGIFAYAFLCLNNIATDTPDMMSTVFMFIALSSVLKIWGNEYQNKDYLIFGFCSGMAYLAKGAALPIVLTCLPFLWWRSRAGKKTRILFCVAIAVLVLIISPYIVCLSIKVGEPTISTAAKLNYIWFEDERTWDVHGPASESKRQSLLHPMRQIYRNPVVFEFAQPVKGTYPPWYDPYYWYAGYKTQLHPGWLFFSLVCNLLYFALFFLGIPLLIVTAVSISYRQFVISRLSFLTNSPLLTVSVVGFLQYAFVLNLLALFPPLTNRYFALPLILFALAVIASLRIQNSKRGIFSFCLTMILIIACLGTSLCQHFINDLSDAASEQYFGHYLIATELKRMGLKQGDYIAQIGTSEPLVDWARLARLKIVADIPNSDELWQVSATKRKEIFSLLRQNGIKTAIYFSAPISKSSIALQKYNHEDWLERLIFWRQSAKISDSKIIEPPQNEGWCRLANLSCWAHKI